MNELIKDFKFAEEDMKNLFDYKEKNLDKIEMVKTLGKF
jgi:hypothetical protein